MTQPLPSQHFSKDAPLISPDAFPSWIIHEDDDILVLNKPGWLVCHPSKNGPWSSLVGAAKEYLEVDSIHLASRLDRETSGVVLLAKHKAAARYWQKGIEEKKVRRAYLAILKGELNEDQTVETYLGNDPSSEVFVKQMVVGKTRKSKFAQTKFSPLFSQNGYTFCRVLTQTGRKHQIRVHAQWMGFPLVGEKLYGADERIYLEFCAHGWRDEWDDILGMPRQALHGRSLYDQRTGQTFHAPLPRDLLDFLQNQLSLSYEAIQERILSEDFCFLANEPKN